jgi:hypothetical protein
VIAGGSRPDSHPVSSPQPTECQHEHRRPETCEYRRLVNNPDGLSDNDVWKHDLGRVISQYIGECEIKAGYCRANCTEKPDRYLQRERLTVYLRNFASIFDKRINRKERI